MLSGKPLNPKTPTLLELQGERARRSREGRITGSSSLRFSGFFRDFEGMGGMGSSFECWDSGFTVRRVEVWEVSEMKAGLMLYIVDYIYLL